MLDPIDLKILALLEKDARLSNQAIGEAVGLTSSSVFERVKKLEKKGVIRGYTAMIDPAAVGRPITAFIRLMIGSSRTGGPRTVADVCRGRTGGPGMPSRRGGGLLHPEGAHRLAPGAGEAGGARPGRHGRAALRYRHRFLHGQGIHGRGSVTGGYAMSTIALFDSGRALVASPRIVRLVLERGEVCRLSRRAGAWPCAPAPPGSPRRGRDYLLAAGQSLTLPPLAGYPAFRGRGAAAGGGAARIGAAAYLAQAGSSGLPSAQDTLQHATRAS